MGEDPSPSLLPEDLFNFSREEVFNISMDRGDLRGDVAVFVKSEVEFALDPFPFFYTSNALIGRHTWYTYVVCEIVLSTIVGKKLFKVGLWLC